MNVKEIYNEKLVALDEAASTIKSGDRIIMSGGPSAPRDLMNAISKRYRELEGVNVFSSLLLDDFDHLSSEYIGHINHHSFFLGPYERMNLHQGNVKANQVQFSRLHYLIRENFCANVAILECSPPDKYGYMSFGPLGTALNSYFIEGVDRIIIQVNPMTPYIYGDKAHIHVNNVDCICEKERKLNEIVPTIPGEKEKRIASYIVDHVQDGSTIQLGIGNIADAVGISLEEKNDLGVHTEMLTNSMVTLAKKGVITCKNKNFHPDRMVCGFGIGTREMYDFIHHNPLIDMRSTIYVNDPQNIGKNDNFISVNSTLSVDLTGQVCSESIGFNSYSGTGGQLDFVRGARLSKGGKSFIALLSTAETKAGKISKIKCSLDPGTIVTTPRTDTMYVVTEYGIVNIWGKSVPDRTKAMISIAHPSFRDQLTAEARENNLI